MSCRCLTDLLSLCQMGKTACLGPFFESQLHYWASNHYPINLTHAILILSPAKTLRVEKNFPSLRQAVVGGSESPQGEDLTSHHLHPNLWPWGSLRRLGGAPTAGAQNRLPGSGPALCSPALPRVWVDLGSLGPLWPSDLEEPTGITGSPFCWGTPLCFKVCLDSQSC